MESKLVTLHKGEIVLNNKNAANLLKTINLSKEFLSKLPKIELPKETE